MSTTRRRRVIAGAAMGWAALGIAALPVMVGAQSSFNSGSTGADGALAIRGLATMNSRRGYHTATLLPNGKVLVTGSAVANGLATAELFDPATGQFSSTGTMTSRRYASTATLLPNGKVLIAGGYNGGSYTTSAELYDPATGAFSPTGSMAFPHGYHTATLLNNGRILLAGSADGSARSSAELYDPGTGQFSTTGGMTAGRYAHTATLLADGKVLIAGGHNGGAYFNAAELYDPSTGTFSATAPMGANRGYLAATLLANGKVLMTGGYGPGPQSTAEIYDPATGRFASTTTSMNASRAEHRAVLLPSGKVLISGGLSPGSISTAETYDPAVDLFLPTGGMQSSRYAHTVTLLANGQVLVAGGHNGGDYLITADLFDPATSLFSTFVFDPRAFNPPLDADGDGVFHFTTISIPSGIIVRLSARYLNGPVYWLASGEVNIDGTIDLRGTAGHPTTNSPGLRFPSEPGAGGFAGGVGGNTTLSPAQPGTGPAGGVPKTGGRFTGNEFLVPLFGGSGGGGYDRPANEGRWGAGGGAGGGGLLIASSASITVRGLISADGGPAQDGRCGSGAGAGGGIRLVAPVVNGNGTLSAAAGSMDASCGYAGPGNGRVRLEAFFHTFSGNVVGDLSRGSPLSSFGPGTASSRVRVVSIAGVPVPPNPTGSFELPDVTVNEGAATLVQIEARQVPPGTTVKLYLFSLEGTDRTVDSEPLQGTLESSAAVASVVFPPGFTRGFARAVWR